MPSSRRFLKIIFASAGLGAAIFGYFSWPETGLFPDRTQASRPPARPAVQRTVLTRAPASPTAVAAVSAAPSLAAAPAEPRPAPVIPAAIRELLPSVDGVVTNWKEFKPQKITIAPYPDMPIEFEATSIREEHGRTVWTGRSAIQGAFLVTVATADEWHADLAIPSGGTFEAEITGSTVTMLAKDDGNNRCGTLPAMARQVTAAAVSAPEEIPAVTGAAEVVSNTVDVLFFYDAETLTAVQGNASTIETRLISYIASSNAALDNSQVSNFRWRYLTAYQVPAYTATNDMANDLNVITGVAQNPNGSYRAASNPVSIFVQQKADVHGADQVVLYVGAPRNFAGIAWLSPSTLAFHTAVVAWPNSPGSSSSYLTVAHEMGHGFGCHHDRVTEQASDNDGHFYYGFRFNQSGRDTGTIMSYANFAVPYYSNPAVTFNGVALGVPEDQPKAANNSRVLREAAQFMINSRAAVDLPAIVTQPQSVTVTVGAPFTLSVTATGSNLTYQWKLGGVDIPGASGASYSKSAAAASDQGSYTVTVSNIAGQTTSNAATVTVNAATNGGGSAAPVAPLTTTPPAASGGGGGGGALDAWFATWCGLLVMARCVLQQRRR